ncbi:ferritin-like domain-containing protein [Mycena rebaudengoi]|jgi:hypothetical protein|nr:ferritin-like domain-containing protein [Mycena rebaudengoi]
MRYSTTLLAALAAPLLVTARPIRRAATANDALVFQFANVLEQLETEFYKQGIAKFKEQDFIDAGFSSTLLVSQTLDTIQKDEALHTTVIQQALKDNGADPLICNFKFDSVLTDVPTMAAVARTVELVGVAAYLGGAVLIDSPEFLAAAASILTIEARHQSVLNILSGTGSVIPAAFDMGFTPQEVLSIAGGFIDGPCDLGLTAANTLTVTNTGTVSAGTLLTVSGTNITGTDNLFCQMMVGGAPFSISLPLADCKVPEGINGPVALWITSDDQPLVNNVVNRDVIKQVAGPAILFVDSQPEMIGSLVRGTGGSGTSGGAKSTETTTISPDDASKIIEGASRTGSAAGSEETGSATGSASGSEESGKPGANGEANGASSAPAPGLPSGSGPDNTTGKSPDGKTTVLGWKTVPKPSS